MGRDNPKYKKTLHQQMYERLVSMQAFGESKKDAMENGTEKDKIFSFATFTTYWKHIKYFIHWLKAAHPDCTTMKAAKKYVAEWLETRTNQTNKNGDHLSAWTIQTEAAALNKLYQIDKADPDRFQPPQRSRVDIKRSRGDTVRDKHFSEKNNDELIKFCRGTGCRRNVLERLEGRDYWTRDRMEAEKKGLEIRIARGEKLPAKLSRHLDCLRTALRTFPTETDFVHHRKDKNGKYRFAPIIGPNRDKIIERFRNTGEKEKVWLYVNGNADIHSYRADYCNAMYKMYARPIQDIPYDRARNGSNIKYQSEVYYCRRDEKGKKLDRRAMKKCSVALGHNRNSVIALSYLRGI